MDPMLMMLPLPCCTMCLAASWARVNMARMLTLKVLTRRDLGMSMNESCRSSCKGTKMRGGGGGGGSNLCRYAKSNLPAQLAAP